MGDGHSKDKGVKRYGRIPWRPFCTGFWVIHCCDARLRLRLKAFLLKREVAYIDGCKMNERYSVEAVFNVDDE